MVELRRSVGHASSRSDGSSASSRSGLSDERSSQGDDQDEDPFRALADSRAGVVLCGVPADRRDERSERWGCNRADRAPSPERGRSRKEARRLLPGWPLVAHCPFRRCEPGIPDPVRE